MKTEDNEEALSHAIARVDAEIPAWIKEARHALDRNDIYLGGGVLRLADLMRQKSHLMARRAAMNRTKA